MEPIRHRIEVAFDYAVHFTEDLFSPANPLFKEVIGAREASPRKVLVVLDEGVVAHHPDLPAAIERYARVHADRLSLAGMPLCMPGGEEAKRTDRAVRSLLAHVEQAGLCRHSYLVALGGGALIDMAGFVAAIAHRGIRLIRVPTTVLGQCDAAVGVKNGINLFGKKNYVGTFAVPHAILNDGRFLTTLGDRDWRAGLAEAVKVALLKDAAFFAALETHADALVRRDLGAMRQVIHRCAALHMAHIATGGDPFELGSSRPLDFGHWAAHKLEQLTGHALRHGEAVAIGLALDSTYAMLAGHLDEAVWRRITRLLRALGFDLFVPELAQGLEAPHDPGSLFRGLEEFREHMGGELTLTLIQGIGRAFDVHAVDLALMKEAIARLEHLHRLETKGEAA